MKRLLLAMMVIPAIAMADGSPAAPSRSPHPFGPTPGASMRFADSTNDSTRPSVMQRRAMAVSTNAISLDPAREAQLEQQMTNVQAKLDAMAQEEIDVRRAVYAQHAAMTNFTASVTTQDVQIARMTARIGELEAELGTLRTQLQVRVQSHPSYRAVDRQSRDIMARVTDLRERRAQLIQDKIRISGELWMIKKTREEQAARGTNAPAAAPTSGPARR